MAGSGFLYVRRAPHRQRLPYMSGCNLPWRIAITTYRCARQQLFHTFLEPIAGRSTGSTISSKRRPGRTGCGHPLWNWMVRSQSLFEIRTIASCRVRHDFVNRRRNIREARPSKRHCLRRHPTTPTFRLHEGALIFWAGVNKTDYRAGLDLLKPFSPLTFRELRQ